MSLRETVEFWATECDLDLTNGEASLLIKLVEDNVTSTNSTKIADEIWDIAEKCTDMDSSRKLKLLSGRLRQ